MEPRLHLEVLTEDESTAAALDLLFGQNLPEDMSYRLIPFNGIEDLRKKLPGQLAAYKRWIPEHYRLIVIIDRDEADCHNRKGELEVIAQTAGLPTKSAPDPYGKFQVINRIAIEELEAWFFGDVPALSAAYPGVPSSLGSNRAFRQPDAIKGGTAERLHGVLQSAGHYTGIPKLPKREVARAIAEQMEPSRNTSPSFRAFWDTVISL